MLMYTYTDPNARRIDVEKCTERLEMLLTKTDKKALQRLADDAGTSKADVIRSAIRRLAKRKGYWNGA